MTLLGLYLDNVLPSAYGVRKPWNFLCTKKYWRGYEESEVHRRQQAKDAEAGRLRPDQAGPNFEEISEQLKQMDEQNECLRIKDLNKRFSNGKKAVEDLSVTMYTNQIFALLGHNGAGKTTTISMITGLVPFSSGAAEVFDCDVFTQMAQIRQFMGVCP